MTDQHPLTVQTCRQLANIRGRLGLAEIDFMRAAADWQLEQVTKWLKDHLNKRYVDVWDAYVRLDTEDVIEDLQKAMRLQEDN